MHSGGIGLQQHMQSKHHFKWSKVCQPMHDALRWSISTRT
jgi:hypothetical protein